jgi:hypothetical protein
MAQAEPTSAHAYDSADLAFFDSVLDNLVEELAATGEGPAMNGSRDALRRQLGVKLFECAEAGERDHVALRQRVLARMFSSKPGIGVRPQGAPAR